MTLEVDVELRRGTSRIEVRFTAGGGITALFGRSGAGKTSIIDAVAGLVRPVRGTITIDGVSLFDAGTGIDLPPHRRRLGYVFQEPRLFPHLSVQSNLRYGRWFTGGRAGQAELDRVVGMLGVEALLARRPGTLSGGEKQRVAIGRALLARPRLLLMDEPLASLDAQRKAEILPYLERLRDEAAVPILYISHQLDEVVRLADTLVLVSGGKVAAAGPVADLLGRLDLRDSLGRFEAGAMLTARVIGSDAVSGLVRLDHPAGRLELAHVDAEPGRTVRIRVRARDVALALAEPVGISIRNRLRTTVRAIDDAPGPVVDVALDAGGEVLLARVTRASVDELGLRPGLAVVALLKTVAVERRGLAVRRDEAG